MTPLDWDRVSEIFADALDRPPAKRAAYVADRCGDDAALRAAVERMLAAEASADAGFLDGPDPALMADAAADISAPPVEAVGPWRLVEEIGRGGMGAVYLAERADGQFEQRGAVKLLKRGRDSDSLLARFLRERQILAGLEHPNIARLLDGGVAPDGRPYFVMEYVDGVPITAFADEGRLDVEGRVTLFRTVCRAVGYAHRNLVVHRDLKPSNILVTQSGEPKLLDFGIAKLLRPGDGPDDTPTLTVGDVRLMTPAYAAPEQIAGGTVTTATDVYGLGAVLYELLSGRTPFDRGHGRLDRPLDAEPMPLSGAPFRHAGPEGEGTGPDDVGPDAGTIASARGTDPARLRRRLAGDLETIAAVALRTDPARRYASADALEADLGRHQNRLPVEARPDTLAYRASRFVRRHRVAVAGTATTVIVAVAFGVTATLQARALEVERDRAAQEAAVSREVSDFLVGVFEASDPSRPGREVRGDTLRALDLLDRGALRVAADLGRDPELQARLLGVMGSAYASLGSSDRAAPLLEQEVEITRALADSAALVAALHRLAITRYNQTRNPEAIALLEEAVEIQERRDPDGGLLWALLVDLAEARMGYGQGRAGRETLDRALELFQRLPYEGSPVERTALGRMVGLLGFGMDVAREDSIFRRVAALEAAESGQTSARYAALLAGWAQAKSFRAEWAAADSLIARSVAIQRALDAAPVPLSDALVAQASYALQQDEPDRALPIALEAERIVAEELGDEHPHLAFSREMLAEAQGQVGMWEEAVATQRKVVEARRSAGHAALLGPAIWRLAVNLQGGGRIDEAEAEYRNALEALTAGLGPEHPLPYRVRAEYGEMLLEAGRGSDAEALLRTALSVLPDAWGNEDPRVDGFRISLASALAAQGRTDEAEAVVGPVVERLEATVGPEDPLTVRARAVLDRVAGKR